MENDVVRVDPPVDPGIREEWVRNLGDDVLGVGAVTAEPGRWQVTAAVTEALPDGAVLTELDAAIEAAARGVPGVSAVQREDGGMWAVRGEVSGAELVRAVAGAVDGLEPRLRQAVAAALPPVPAAPADLRLPLVVCIVFVVVGVILIAIGGSATVIAGTVAVIVFAVIAVVLLVLVLRRRRPGVPPVR